jgi:hypothetical protein
MTTFPSGASDRVAPPNRTLADSALLTPVARYRLLQDAAKTLLDPLLPLMEPGRAEVAIADPRPTVIGTVGNALCTRFEACVRPLLLAAHWLHSLRFVPRPEHEPVRQRVSAWFRAALVLGTDEDGPLYWGADANYYQLHVDMGLLPVAFALARGDLWDPLTPAEKAQIARWLGTSRGAAYVHANHYFMGIHVLEFLQQEGFGHRVDRPLIDVYFARLETMARDDGWFEDGANQSFDYYNAYAFHYYGLWWARLHGRHDPARATRWRDWTRIFLADYEHFFAVSGENAPYGRSLPYRFNAIGIFGLAALEGACDLPLGRVRRLCLRNLDFFLQRPIYQEQGCLALGWTDHFDPIGENYLKPGSPYWAAKGLSPLLLEPSHPFWKEPESPLLSELGDYSRPMPPAGLLVRAVHGAVEIVNAGGQISESRVFMGVWKWSKTSYRSGVGFTVPAGGDLAWSIDSALTQTVDDGRVFGRHATHALTVDPTHVHFAWNMGDRNGPVSTGVESVIFCRSGWLLQLHHCDPHQPTVLTLGGFALSASAGDEISFSKPTPHSPLAASAWTRDGRGTVLQGLMGFDRIGWETRLDDSTPRTHLFAPFHATPYATSDRSSRPRTLAALTWAGDRANDAQCWSVQSQSAGHWVLSHATLGTWDVRHEALPAV